jgi:hypothetical protein
VNPEGETKRWPRIVVIVLLAALALATRLPAPWRAEVINDEMYHLESWMRRYRTDDIAPLFHRQIAGTSVLSASQKAWVEDLYRRSPLVQRLVCIKNDYGSFGFSTMAEVIEYTSHSDLVALRLPSVAIALGTIVLAYLVGAALRDRTLGLWLAAFVTVGPLPQIYAGLGRPHGLTQFALYLVFYRFVLEQKNNYSSPWRLLLAALLAQTTHLTCWAAVGLLVLSELVRRYLRGSNLLTLFRQTWWYAAISVAFLGLIATNAVGTSIFSANVSSPGPEKIWRNFCLASPFGHLASLGREATWASGILFLAAILAGLIALFASSSSVYRGIRWPIVLIAGLTAAVPIVASNEVRHQMIYGVMPMILAAMGARAVFRSEAISLAALTALLLLLGGLALFRPADPYETILSAEERYSQIADRLAQEMKPGDIWISWPYFAGIPLALYHPLPEPILPLNQGELEEALRTRPADRDCYVLTSQVFVPSPAKSASEIAALGGGQVIASYRNEMVILRFPAHLEGSSPRRDNASNQPR